jgi:hypothetical protein
MIKVISGSAFNFGPYDPGTGVRMSDLFDGYYALCRNEIHPIKLCVNPSLYTFICRWIFENARRGRWAEAIRKDRGRFGFVSFLDAEVISDPDEPRFRFVMLEDKDA